MDGKQSQADAAACTIDKEESLKKYAAAMETTRSMKEALATLQSNGK